MVARTRKRAARNSPSPDVSPAPPPRKRLRTQRPQRISTSPDPPAQTIARNSAAARSRKPAQRSRARAPASRSKKASRAHSSSPEIIFERLVNQKERECTSCATEHPASEFPSIPISQKCKHSNDTCNDCLQAWLDIRVRNSAPPPKVTCPQCEIELGYEEVRALASPPIFEAYDHLLLVHQLSGLADFRWCLQPDCHSGQLHPGGDEAPIFTCSSCDRRSCYACEVPWHEGLSCMDYQGRTVDPRTTQVVESISQQCPGCGAAIQKNGGCDHMTCTLCSAEFCYICRVDYKLIREGDNSAHAEGCKYRTPGTRPEDADDRAESEEDTDMEEETEEDEEEADDDRDDEGEPPAGGPSARAPADQPAPRVTQQQARPVARTIASLFPPRRRYAWIGPRS